MCLESDGISTNALGASGAGDGSCGGVSLVAEDHLGDRPFGRSGCVGDHMLAHEGVAELLTGSLERGLVVAEDEHDEIVLIGLENLERGEALDLSGLVIEVSLRRRQCRVVERLAHANAVEDGVHDLILVSVWRAQGGGVPE
jgi:hypothetical protein